LAKSIRLNCSLYSFPRLTFTMLNPIQRYFPKLHRLLATHTDADVSFDPELDAQFSSQNHSRNHLVEPFSVESFSAESFSAEHLNQAHSLLTAGNLPEAIAHYRQILQRDPTCGTVYPYLAEALSQQGELEAAAVCYRQAIELSMQEAASPKRRSGLALQIAESLEDEDEIATDIADESEEDAEDEISWFETAAFHLQQGEALYNRGDWTETLAACEQAIQLIEPQIGAAYLTAAKALQQQRNLTAAASLYLKAIAIQPTAEVHARLGSLHAQQNRLSEATLQYQQAIALDPQFAGAYWKLAAVLQQSGEAEQALVCRYRALQQQPQWAFAEDAVKLAGELRQQGKLEWAIDCYQQAIRRDPSAAEAYHGLGETLGQQGDWQAAIAPHRQAVLHQPNKAQFQLGLGEALGKQEEWDEALLCFRLVTQLEPENLQGHQRLGQALGKLDRWTEALSCYQTLTELQPRSGKAFHDLGDVFSRLQQWSAAADAFQQAIALQPQFSWSHNNLGDALIHLEDWQAAAAAFQQAIALNPAFHWSHYNLGEALVQLEQWDGAIAAYQTALELQPNLPQGQRKIADALHQRAKADQIKALAYYQQAIAQHPDDLQNYHRAIALQPDKADFYVQLADALVRQNNPTGAVIFYQQAQKLQPVDQAIELGLATALEQQTQAKQQYSQGATHSAANRSVDLYDYWITQNTPTDEALRNMAKSVRFLAYQPLISVVMPTYNTPERFLRAAIDSVLNQAYPYWELCIADDASTEPHVRRILEDYAAKETRIKLALREQNGHIAAASNSALKLAIGEYVALLDHDDAITPDALYQVVTLLNQHPEADMIYSDEDKWDEQEKRMNPFFKPDWCPDSFLTRMYTCHLGVYRRALVEQVGGFRVGYEGSQDYDLVLRVTEQTQNIFHLPKILYHWRINAASVASSPDAKPYAYEAAVKAIADALDRRGEGGRVLTNPRYPGTYTIRYAIPKPQLVSIIIPTRDLGSVLDRCLESIFAKSTYPNYEIILIDNGSEEPETLALIKAWKRREGDRFKSYRLDVPFNFSTINNYAVAQAKGEYLLFLNNDTEVIEPDWIEAMVEQAQRESIGAVGALLLYPDETIQHAGVVLGIGGIGGHSHKHFPATHPGYFNQVLLTSNYSAVTAACLMCRREVFEAIGGFDEQLSVAFNDVDLCLKMQEKGYQNIYLPHVKLYHHESKSRGYEDTPEKIRRFEKETAVMKRKWNQLLQQDPCYNPNLTKEREDFTLPLPPLDLEVLAVSEATNSPLILDCAIDSFKVGQKASSFYVGIAGWVVGRKSRAVTVQVWSDDRILHTIPVKHPRLDVARVHSGILNAETSGFAGAIALVGSSHIFLSLRVVFADGSSEALSQIELRRLAQ
jgi:O-antigen biosynthesis protein